MYPKPERSDNGVETRKTRLKIEKSGKKWGENQIKRAKKWKIQQKMKKKPGWKVKKMAKNMKKTSRKAKKTSKNVQKKEKAHRKSGLKCWFSTWYIFWCICCTCCTWCIGLCRKSYITDLQWVNFLNFTQMVFHVYRLFRSVLYFRETVHAIRRSCKLFYPPQH